MDEEKDAANTWQQLAILQAETESILQSVRSKRDAGGRQSKDKKTRQASGARGDVGARPVRGLTTMASDKQSGNNKLRLTLEIKDADSPDISPRDVGEDRARAHRLELKAMRDARLKKTEALEGAFQRLPFDAERSRVVRHDDIFVSAPSIDGSDVAAEKQRLTCLEDSARKTQRRTKSASESRQMYTLQELAAGKIQSAFRGLIGRRRYRLIWRLQQVQQQHALESDWIEVRDGEKGDVWYYNRHNGKSQWDRPDEIYSSLVPIRTKPLGQKPFSTAVVPDSSEAAGVLKLSMTLPSTSASKKASAGKKRKNARAVDSSVQREIDTATGVDKISPSENLFAPDGYFKPQLRTTVVDTLLESRFDSISSVLADDRWMETDNFLLAKASKGAVASDAGKGDLSKIPLVSVVNLDKPKKITNIDIAAARGSALTDSARNFTVHEVDHPVLQPIAEANADGNFEASTMCFGCWSAGVKRSCMLHNDGNPTKASQTMLLCRNWELGVMRRRYRSEEIQEIFMKKASSLRYDVKRKQFLTVVEQRHQIYRGLKSLIECFNFRMLLWMKIKRWLFSLSDEVRTKPSSGLAKERIRMMRMRRTLVHGMQVGAYLREIVSLLPLPPITGSSWPERTGEIQFLLRRADQASGQEVELIVAHPTPPCKTLFLAREYHVAVPRTIPMPTPVYTSTADSVILPATKFVREGGAAAWLERMSSAMSRSVLQATLDQIKSITPMAGIELIRRTKQPAPCTIKFATIGRKPEPGNLCIGGLAVELLIYQLISTYIPPQYGNFMVVDKSTISPGVSPEIIISFQSLLCEPITQVYFLRSLEHPLNYRRAPTITANSATDAHNKHYYGLNRPEQTGEQEPHGFRTTCWARNLLTHVETDPSTFTPGPEIVSLNVPSSNRSVTTHADHTYPFCEPSTRDNSSLDFFHLLLQGAISGSKSQVFTALTVQEPGLFLRECREDLPMGHLVVSVYRSWSFTQKDTIEEFKTDDGISYWYHRRTGQTFWERPLYEEEEPTALNGGTILDQIHSEEPLTVHKGHEGAERRYLQGEFRKQMLAHHETDAEAKKRRMTAQSSAKIAKDRGLIPQFPAGYESAINEDPGDSKILKAGMHDSYAIPATNNTFENPPLKGLPPAEQSQQQIQIQSRPQQQHPQQLQQFTQQPQNGLSVNSMQALTQSLGQILSTMGMMESSTPQEIIQLGMGMGMSLLSADVVQGLVSGITGGVAGAAGTAGSNKILGNNQMSGIRAPNGNGGEGLGDDGAFFPSLSEEDFKNATSLAGSAAGKDEGGLPIGKPQSTQQFSSEKMLDRAEQEEQLRASRAQLETPLTAVQNARSLNVQLDPTETPDVAPAKVLTVELPLNAELGVKESTPLLVYPELSSWPAGGPPKSISTHGAAGEGTSFVLKENEHKILKVEGSEILRKAVVPLPVGFFNAIVAKHIAKQAVDYLPMVPNLPQSRTVGRVKPRSSAIDWMAISFDPWSAGKKPLNAEFVPSLAAKAEKLFGNDPSKAHDLMDQMRESNKDAFMTVDDKDGMAEARAEITKGQLLAQDFAKACSLCRHSKFGDVEQMVNQPDWNVPIDYQDDMGNTLLHVVAQNGNRRLVKLCLRRGADLNLQNLSGQTALHFAFGYGYVEVGEYLVKKGADDSLRNKDGNTCYEGLSGRELSLL